MKSENEKNIDQEKHFPSHFGDSKGVRTSSNQLFIGY